MDDILASIRKIIADDFSTPDRFSGGGSAAGYSEAASGEEEEHSDVLDLGSQPALVHSLAGHVQRQAGFGDASAESRRDTAGLTQFKRPTMASALPENGVAGSDASEEVQSTHSTDRHVRSVSERLSTLRPSAGFDASQNGAGRASAEPDVLIARTVEASVTSAFKNLQDVSRKAAMDTKPVITSPTLETVVLDALKPMLREWLDANLPLIVNDLVRAEIKRLSEPR